MPAMDKSMASWTYKNPGQVHMGIFITAKKFLFILIFDRGVNNGSGESEKKYELI